jgi:ammonium transporter, Amt family
MFLDKIRGYEITAVETCLGILVGLVAITPASGYVSIEHAVSIGCIASIISYIIVSEFKIINDALDVFGCHALGGISGMLLTGVFANKAINPSITDAGLLFGGSTLFLNQILAVIIVSVFSFGVSYLLFMIVNAISPIKVTELEEINGLDSNQFTNK